MKMFYKSKHKIVLMIILALMFQIVGPVVGDYAYASEGEKAFTFVVVPQPDGSGRFEWTYNPNKANGQREFEVVLGLELTADFEGLLEVEGMDDPIGEFVISKEGKLTAAIYEREPEELKDTEGTEEVEVSTMTVVVQGDMVVIEIEVEESLEGQTAKVEILDENQELVSNMDVTVKENSVTAGFESLQPGSYLARVTVGDFVVEEDFEIVEENKPVQDPVDADPVEVDGEDDNDDDEEDKPGDESAPEVPKETEEPEGTSIIGDAIAVFASAIDSFGGMLAEAEEEEEEILSDWGIFGPGTFKMSTYGAGTDLGDIFTFKSFTLNESEVTNFDVPIVIELGTKMKLEYNWSTVGKDVVNGSTAEVEIPDAFIRAGADVNFTNIPLTLTNGTHVGKYSILGGKILITFDQRMVEYQDGEGSIDNGFIGFEIKFNEEKFQTDIVQEITFSDSSDKTMTVIAKPSSFTSGLNKTVKDVPKDGKEIEWTLDIINSGPDKMTAATISDALPEGLTIESSDIEVFDLTVGFDGNPKQGNKDTNKTAAVTTAEGKDSFSIDLGNIDPYKGYRVKYTTKIINNTEKDKTFTNNAVLNYNNGQALPSKATTNAIERSDFIEKKGTPVGKDKIEWTIDINKGKGEVTDAVVKDLLPTGLKLSSGTNAKLYNISNSTSAVVKAFDDLTSMKIGDLKGNHYRIIFETDVDYSQVNGGDYKETNMFINTAILEDGEKAIGKKEAEVTINRDPILTKSGSGNLGYDYAKKEIKWKLEVNKAKHKIDGATITDKLPAGLTINKSDIVIKDSSGGVVSHEDITVTVPVNDGTEETTITIVLGNITDSYTIEYPTKIVEGSLKESGFTNEAKLVGTGVGVGTGDNHNIVKEPVTITDNSYKKTFVIKNYDQKTMDWMITINPKRDAITSLVITDTFPNKGLILLPGTLKVTLDVSELNLNTDYTLEPRTEDGVLGYQKGFVLDFANYFESGTDKLLNNELVITYTTSYDTDLGAEPNTDTADSKDYRNRADFTVATKNNGDSTPSSEVGNTVIDESWNSGYKIGKLKSIDPDNNTLVDGWISGNERRVQWEVYTNYLKQNLGNNVIVTDELGYEGDIHDIEVRTYTVDSSSGDTTIDWNSVEPVYSIENKTDKGFKLTFNQAVEERYVIVFNTTVPKLSKGKAESEAYTNTATLNDGTNDYPYKASKGFDNANNHVSKEALGEAVVDQELKWKVKINESLSIIEKDVTVVDTLSAGLAYMPGSLRVYRLDGSARTLIEIEDYYSLLVTDLPENKTELKIMFKHEVSSAYEIDYTTIVTAKKGVKVNNKVEYSGLNLSKKSQEDIKLTAQQFSWSGGGNNPDLGLIEITKKDGDGEAIKNLPATFELEYSLVEDGIRYPFGDGVFTTDNNGELKIGDLPLNRFYYLTETEAPTGYKISENQENEEWAKFEVKKASSAPYKFGIINTKMKTSVTVEKIWLGEADESVKVILLADGVPKDEITLNKDNGWIHTFDDLDQYDGLKEIAYTVEEVVLSSEHERVSIVEEPANKFTITNRNISLIDIPVKKNWVGAYDQDTEITIVLEQDESKFLTLNKTNSWEDKFKNLRQYDDEGNKINYSIKEVAVDGYRTAIAGSGDIVGFEVTNTIQGKVSIAVTKEWIGRKANSVEVILLANGTEISRKILGDSNSWMHTFTNLEQYDNSGKEINYNINEVRLGNYDTTIIRNGDSFRIINEYVPPYYPPYEPDKPDPKDPDKPVDPEDPKDPPKKNPDKPVDPEETPDPTETPDPDNPDEPGTEDPTDPNEPGSETPEPDPTKPIVIDPPTKGTITFDEDGNWIYTPDEGEKGTDTFTIVHPDGREETITINLDDIGIGTIEVTAETLPKTGSVSNLGFYLAGLSMIFLGIFLRKRKTV